jgi:hypothetical protein
MDIINISEIFQIPTNGKVVVFIMVDSRAPCKKFLSYAQTGINIVEKNPTGASYYLLPFTNEIKETLRLSGMPTTIVYVDGIEKKRFQGHFWSEFEIANMISEGFNK